ncbi:hypothetical protein D3C80_1133910 [compost metagenome]
MALLTRLDSTCLKRMGSTNTSPVISASISNLNANPFWRATPSNNIATASIKRRISARCGCRIRRSASMREISRMSPIKASREWADSCATLSSSRSKASSRCGRFSNSSNMPIMALSGVRISWLMVARKVVLARLALSARSFACCNCAIRRSRSVTSNHPPILPSAR